MFSSVLTHPTSSILGQSSNFDKFPSLQSEEFSRQMAGKIKKYPKFGFQIKQPIIPQMFRLIWIAIKNPKNSIPQIF